MVIYKGSIGSMNNFSIDDTIYVFKQDEFKSLLEFAFIFNYMYKGHTFGN